MISPIGVFVEGFVFGCEIHKSRALKFIFSLVICFMSCSFYRNVYTTVLCLSLEIRAVVVCVFVLNRSVHYIDFKRSLPQFIFLTFSFQIDIILSTVPKTATP